MIVDGKKLKKGIYSSCALTVLGWWLNAYGKPAWDDVRTITGVRPRIEKLEAEAAEVPKLQATIADLTRQNTDLRAARDKADGVVERMAGDVTTVKVDVAYIKGIVVRRFGQ